MRPVIKSAAASRTTIAPACHGRVGGLRRLRLVTEPPRARRGAGHRFLKRRIELAYDKQAGCTASLGCASANNLPPSDGRASKVYKKVVCNQPVNLFELNLNSVHEECAPENIHGPDGAPAATEPEFKVPRGTYGVLEREYGMDPREERPMRSLKMLKDRVAGVDPFATALVEQRQSLGPHPTELDSLAREHADGPNSSTFLWGCLPGWTYYYNSLVYRVPFVNLMWPYFSSYNEQILYSQYTSFLNNTAIVTALVLALTCTFYQSVSYNELRAADLRFGYACQPGEDFFTTPWDNHIYERGFREYVSDSDSNSNPIATDATKALIKNGTAVPDAVYERGRFMFTVVDASGGDLTGKCPCPCFERRVIDELGTMVTGKYAEWWYATNYELSFTTEITMSQAYNYLSVVSMCTLMVSLLTSVIMLGLSNANHFLDENNVESHANALVMKAYGFWIRLSVIGIIGTTVVGVWFFFSVLEYMVYIKYTDMQAARFGKGISDEALGSYENVYAFTYTTIFYVIYALLVIALLVLSLGQHAAYTFPLRTYGSQKDEARVHDTWLESVLSCFRPTARTEWHNHSHGDSQRSQKRKPELAEITDYRLARQYDLARFLAEECDLPNTKQWCGGGPRGDTLDVFMSVAAGDDCMEAELVAQILIDNHIDSPETIVSMVKNKKTRHWLAELPGISAGASVAIEAAILHEQWGLPATNSNRDKKHREGLAHRKDEGLNAQYEWLLKKQHQARIDDMEHLYPSLQDAATSEKSPKAPAELFESFAPNAKPITDRGSQITEPQKEAYWQKILKEYRYLKNVVAGWRKEDDVLEELEQMIGDTMQRLRSCAMLRYRERECKKADSTGEASRYSVKPHERLVTGTDALQMCFIEAITGEARWKQEMKKSMLANQPDLGTAREAVDKFVTGDGKCLCEFLLDDKKSQLQDDNAASNLMDQQLVRLALKLLRDGQPYTPSAEGRPGYKKDKLKSKVITESFKYVAEFIQEDHRLTAKALLTTEEKRGVNKHKTKRAPPAPAASVGGLGV